MFPAKTGKFESDPVGQPKTLFFLPTERGPLSESPLLTAMMQGSFIAYSHNFTPEAQNLSSLQDANEVNYSVTKASVMKGKLFSFTPHLSIENL